MIVILTIRCVAHVVLPASETRKSSINRAVDRHEPGRWKPSAKLSTPSSIGRLFTTSTWDEDAQCNRPYSD